jgi:hypothetical protein
MCHYKRTLKIHLKIYCHSVRILVRIWNALSLSIFYNWQVLLVYSLLNFFYEYESFLFSFFLQYTIYNTFWIGCIIVYIIYCALVALYYIVHYAQYNMYTTLCIVHNIIYIVYLIQLQCFIQKQWVEFLSKHSTFISSIRLFLDNDYGTIIPQTFFKLVLPNISLNMNVLKVISH